MAVTLFFGRGWGGGGGDNLLGITVRRPYYHNIYTRREKHTSDAKTNPPPGNVLISILLRNPRYFSFSMHFGMSLLRAQQALLTYTVGKCTEHCKRNETIIILHYTGVYIGRSGASMHQTIITHSQEEKYITQMIKQNVSKGK